MEIIRGSDVNRILPKVVEYLLEEGKIEKTRNGDAIVAPCPVMTVYENPKNKVLFNPIRDVNPFFGIMESFWMLHGDEDAEFLNYYVKDFGSRFAEDEGHIAGAYGQRWRTHFGLDQLKIIIKKFKENPLDRQCVLQMWDPNTPDNGANDLLGNWKDRPCNLCVIFRINNGRLDITTAARSHDAIFGSTGANAVHFPFMMEYVAGMVGVETGKFYQFSNNLHMYVDIYEKLLSRLSPGDNDLVANLKKDSQHYEFDNLKLESQPLVSNPESFDYELDKCMKTIRKIQREEGKYEDRTYKNTFLQETVLRVAQAHYVYKKAGAKTAIQYAELISAPDWKFGCVEWLQRRIK